MRKVVKEFNLRFNQNQCVRKFLSLLVNLTAQTKSSDVFVMSIDAFGDFRNDLNELFLRKRISSSC